MKLVAPVALLFAGASLVACGSAAVNQRAAVAKAVRSWAANQGDRHVILHGVRVSKIDPKYAIAREEYTRPDGKMSAQTWFLDLNGSRWRPVFVGNLFPTCSTAPANVRRELYDTTACYPPVGVYTSIPWTRGKSVRLRYCTRPGGPGNFIAASAGVTCHTAAAVAHAVESLPCSARSQCLVASFRCVEYYDGRSRGGSFAVYHHALCTNGRRRIEWDGG